jgi:hypothetical protein
MESMTRTKQTARRSSTPPMPRLTGELPMVQSYPLEEPTDDEEVAHLVRCVQGEKEKEPTGASGKAPKGKAPPVTYGKAPRKALKVKAPPRAFKPKKPTGQTGDKN